MYVYPSVDVYDVYSVGLTLIDVYTMGLTLIELYSVGLTLILFQPLRDVCDVYSVGLTLVLFTQWVWPSFAFYFDPCGMLTSSTPLWTTFGINFFNFVLIFWRGQFNTFEDGRLSVYIFFNFFFNFLKGTVQHLHGRLSVCMCVCVFVCVCVYILSIYICISI
jgi:hypothetical protein